MNGIQVSFCRERTASLCLCSLKGIYTSAVSENLDYTPTLEYKRCCVSRGGVSNDVAAPVYRL